MTLTSLRLDFKYAVRFLTRRPSFTVGAVVILAVGLAATTIILSLVNVVLLHPLPYADSSRLVKIWETFPTASSGPEPSPASYMDYLDWRTQTRAFTDLAAYTKAAVTLQPTSDEPERLNVEYITDSYLPVLGIQPLVGRNITAEENIIGSSRNVLLISERLWRTRFGSKQDLLGQGIRVDDHLWTVVGVLPKGFRGLSDSADLWAPVVTQLPAPVISDRGNMWLDVIGRLKPYTTIEAARADLGSVANRLAQQYSDDKDRRTELVPLQVDIYGNLRPITLVLICSVIVLFVVVCVNVANLELIQAEARRAEISLRLALGSRSLQIIRQFGAESLLIVFAGCLIALPVAAFGIKELNLGQLVGLPSFANPEINLTVAAVVSLFAVLVGLTLGFFASSQAINRGLIRGLREADRSGSGLRSHIRGLMVTAQVALAVALLIAAALLGRTFQNLQSIDPGYEQASVLTFYTSLPQSITSSKSAVQQIVSSLSALPGVTNVSASNNTPLDGQDSATDMYLEGMSQANGFPRVHTHRIDASFFDALGVGLKQGRSFSADDVASSRQVAVVSQSLVHRYWQGQNPIGKKLVLNPELKSPPYEVVGVAPDLLFRNIPESSDKDPDVYVPLSDRNRMLGFLVRTRTAVNSGMISSVRVKVRETLPGAPIYNVATVRERVDQQMRRFRFAARLMLVFAIAAVLMAITGTYGVTSYAISQRTREFAIRIALGAPVLSVISLVLHTAAIFAAVGIGVGLVVSSIASHLLAPLLYRIAPVDLSVYLFTAALCMGIIVISCLVPAWRVLSMNTTAALRAE